MRKIRIFIISVQVELAAERSALYEYLHSDPLLGKFFEPFLFELLPATDQNTSKVYLKEVELCDIYLGILGNEYGFEDSEGVSPTEREFNHATELLKTRLIFLKSDNSSKRHPKENDFINKVQAVLVRKRFSSIEELRFSVYAALVKYLEEKEIIRVGPFDASLNPSATFEDINSDKIISFVKLAKSKRGFPLPETSSAEEVLTHLNLCQDQRLTNAALLLFGNDPQRFFINSEVRCAYFHGTIVEKPIPSYKVFQGDVFELVNQAEDFILSKLNYSIGTRSENADIPGQYEIPREAITEALVNAIAHRDYTSNGSVQVMLFRDRLEIWNPGLLPMGWTAEKLKTLHSSIPFNPLLAHPMYLAGYIERLGTGTADMVRLSKEAGLQEPKFIQEEDFKTILFRNVTGQVTGQADEEISIEIRKVVLVMNGEMKRADIQKILQLSNRENFVNNYIIPAIENGYIRMKFPDSPKHPQQRYVLTEKGGVLRNQLKTDI